MTRALALAPEDPRSTDARALLERHLAFAAEHTPEGHVHALDVDAVASPDVVFFGARRSGRLVAVGALRAVEDAHFEVKSMHVLTDERGRGTGHAMLVHLLSEVRARGGRRVSLETGTQDAFGPARALYASAGFTPCEPFGGYWRNPNSVCMTLSLEAGD